MCDHIATGDHITSRKHQKRYSEHLEHPVFLPPARLPPAHSARAAASGSGAEPAPPPPPPPPPAQAMDGQSPVAGPPPAPPRPVDEQQDIQQGEQAVDQLVSKLAVLLEQANGVLADIIHARRAERRAVNADQPPFEPQQLQVDAERRRRDEPQQQQAPPEGGKPQQHQPHREEPQLTNGHGPAPQNGPPAEHQNGGWYGRWWWRHDAQPARGTWYWDEWIDVGHQ